MWLERIPICGAGVWVVGFVGRMCGVVGFVGQTHGAVGFVGRTHGQTLRSARTDLFCLSFGSKGVIQYLSIFDQRQSPGQSAIV